jgi:hypothetical protein
VKYVKGNFFVGRQQSDVEEVRRDFPWGSAARLRPESALARRGEPRAVLVPKILGTQSRQWVSPVGERSCPRFTSPSASVFSVGKSLFVAFRAQRQLREQVVARRDHVISRLV